MSGNLYDAVIIGGGMSGLTAAIALAKRGRSVAVISRGNPACCLSTGCIDVLSDTDDPLRDIERLPGKHPYHIVGRQAIMEALEFFREVMARTGLPYEGDINRNRTILTPLGTKKITCLVPVTMAAADPHADGPLHIVTFAGLKDFYPSYITARSETTRYSVFNAGVSTTAALAERFEEARFRDEFVTWLRERSHPDEAVAVPAVLGIRTAPAILRELVERLEQVIFEIPTLPPSIPGQRLFTRLKNVFLEQGGDLYWGRDIASFERLGDRIEAVTLETSGRPTRVEGRAFILATGSFISGGLFASMEGVRETVFNLSTYLPSERKHWFNENFFTPGHPVEKAGIRVDSTFRPLHSGFANLFVCGSILAFSEVMKYGCGHGMAIATAAAAARMCERQL
ncbi:MAG: anaerobic glycerol-3-phosphate dehydrogenase subunit B [Deltaproteobacteria bacterium]|nr:anaerobic glycerol-3-phosphate dehydrogenase subunit B [Deltaproteobacteria bacterium]